jgi:hypothetical protein
MIFKSFILSLFFLLFVDCVQKEEERDACYACTKENVKEVDSFMKMNTPVKELRFKEIDSLFLIAFEMYCDKVIYYSTINLNKTKYSRIYCIKDEQDK